MSPPAFAFPGPMFPCSPHRLSHPETPGRVQPGKSRTLGQASPPTRNGRGQALDRRPRPRGEEKQTETGEPAGMLGGRGPGPKAVGSGFLRIRKRSLPGHELPPHRSLPELGPRQEQSLGPDGPILDPEMRALALTPICPFTLSNRPIVLQGSEPVYIEVESSQRTEVILTVDGQDTLPLREGDRLCFQVADADALIIRSDKRNFYEVLRSKLNWSGGPDA